MTSGHVRWDKMLSALEQGATEPDISRIERHLASCSRCRRRTDELRDVLARFEDAADAAPSPGLVRATVALIREAVADRAAGAGAGARDILRHAGAKIREVLARPAADSLRPAFAVRGAIDAAPRVIVYEAEGYAISVSRTTGPGESMIRGQVIPRGGPQSDFHGFSDLPDARVELVSGEGRWDSPLSPFGEFRFPDVPVDGDAALTVHLGELRIRIASVPPPGSS